MPTKAPIVSQFRYSRFTVEAYNRDVALLERVDQAPCITFGQFRYVAEQRGWTIDSLTALVKGELDEPKRTLERILKTGPTETVIPYTCLIELYQQSTQPKPAVSRQKACACGCGALVRDKKKWATPGCRKRVQRGSVIVQKMAL